ncbi:MULTISPECIES: cation:proton antiporter [Ramlibacter]|uniref:Sodium:proton antiporter n=1 Tax=Ramlibacter pinisoli TaxID=2682844 RepID=A0A6N8IR43_9BURK|nr:MULTISPECIES: cation:proton antiporter [Ramlibacter]MBA2964049.1 cation:proton antiporter [Ramlibacter sp. CGMCC 1.13660]MVQ29015.1 sodium:proton antiporter [Ramlibacter pinisoli]
MAFALWSVLIGLLLIVLALAGTVLARLPLSTAMLYLAVGVAVSPLGLGWIQAGPLSHTVLLERLTEVVVLVSLFTAGLKLSHGLGDRRWLEPLRLATTSMVVTIACIAAAGHFLLGLSVGAAVLLGGLLAPTDPVLASDVQVQEPGDQDQVRFALTGEGGLNDGTAFPFVMLGLGLLGLHDLGAWGWRWIAVDFAWAIAAGIGIGAVLGIATGRLVLYLRREHKEAVGLDDFLALGLIALAYGTAVLAHAYGFLAVFAAGVALRRLVQEQGESPASTQRAVEQAAATPDRHVADKMAVDRRHAPAFMAHAVLGFNQQLERIGEVAVVVTIGSLLWAVEWQPAAWWFVPLLLLVIRPLSVALGLAGARVGHTRRLLLGWFGIRGIGSLYYLAYAINHGLDPQLAARLSGLTLAVVVASIVLHGVSVTPLMAAYERRSRRGDRVRPG